MKFPSWQRAGAQGAVGPWAPAPVPVEASGTQLPLSVMVTAALVGTTLRFRIGARWGDWDRWTIVGKIDTGGALADVEVP